MGHDGTRFMTDSTPFRPRFSWSEHGIIVEIPAHEREVLISLLDQLREVIAADDHEPLARLKLPAHVDDPAAEAQFQELIAEDLRQSRIDAVEQVIAGLDATLLDDDGAAAWMRSLNSLRLVLGHEPWVTDDELDPSSLNQDQLVLLELFEWSGWLLEQLVAASTSVMDADPSDPDSR